MAVILVPKRPGGIDVKALERDERGAGRHVAGARGDVGVTSLNGW